MEIFYKIGYRKGQLEVLNRCRLFLHVLTLADITSMCRKYAIRDVREGIANFEITDETYQWPEQGNPSKNDWVEWKEAIKQLCIGNVWQLRTPLGHWTIPKDGWTWYFREESCRVYEKKDEKWWFYIHHGRNDRPEAGYFDTPTEAEDWPNDSELLWAHVGRGANRIYLKGYSEEAMGNAELPAITSVERAIKHLTDSEQYLLRNLTADEGNVEGIANSIKDGHARIVSNGSYYKGTGVATFAVRIESADKQYSLDIEQYVPDVLAENDTYRAEATGILAGLCICWAICKYKDITGGNVKIGCDGELALNMAMHKQWDVRISDKHYNIIDMIHCRKKAISQTMTKHWIRGHQDTNRPFRLLDRMTQMNILCDQAAWEMGARKYTQSYLRKYTQRCGRYTSGGAE